MAYNPQDPNKLKDENEVGVDSPAPQLSTPSSSIGQGSPATGNMAGPAARTPSASGFTNVQKYIKANEQQGGALGQKIAGKVDSSIDQASDKAGSSAQGYRNTVNPDQFKFDANTFNPMNVDQNNFNNIFSAPRKSTFDDSDARSSVAQAQKNAAQIQSNEGRDQLVGEEQTLTRDKGLNTAGLRHFDRLLFQGSGQGAAAIKNTGNRLASADLETKLADQANIARSIDQEGLDAQQAAQRSARGAVSASAAGLQGEIAQATAQQKAQAEANQNRIFQAITNRQDVSDADLSSFGLDRNQSNQISQAFAARQKQSIENALTDLDNKRINRTFTPEDSRRESGLRAARDSGNMALAQELGVDSSFDLAPHFQRSDLSGFNSSNAVNADQIARARALENLSRIAGNPLENIAPQAASQFGQNFGSTDFAALMNSLNVPETALGGSGGGNRNMIRDMFPASGGFTSGGTPGRGRDLSKEVQEAAENPLKAVTGGLKIGGRRIF